MDIKQVRIGNYINYNYLGTSIVSVIESGDDITEADSNQYTPIELTEEWLLKLGFEKSETENQFRFKERLIIFDQGVFIDFGSRVILKTVHQTQNFIFALTGKELITK